ncbi:ferrichrome siderophore peptide synthetase [Fusarium subglutinans]|uniref:Ferrichrome siderophore peptide synthetase n=1 Tax=Gibberella subglutinans TaxID=42677 RepID=A0A8H5L2A8_GIBSU|nr:ferrichrome siderophore peptide synthetase [Fusarium subglutinans]KAF5583502.1 ferrichrome siderophore peptide synthetase [Fusarium subglutinans]
MDNAMSMTRAPVTQLRPLHTQRQSAKESRPISWTSSVEPRADEETAIKAFVKLVSHLVILDEGENFCIQHTKRGGFFLAQYSSSERNEPGSFRFVKDENHQDIPSDFSIGEGQVSLMLVPQARGVLQLKTDASIIPESALRSLGCMLDDILTGSEWTQPSVLNFPPRSEPISLTHGDGTLTNDGTMSSLIYHQFERRASETPDRVAIDYLTDLESESRVTFTYRQIANAATALAGKIAKACEESTQSLKTVAVLIGPCPELYISYLAALKAGFAFCPIAIDAPRERKEALMADLKPSALLTTTFLLESASSSFVNSSSETINVTPFLQACDTEPEKQPTTAPRSANDLAYILYTSGTTGLPKGVAVSHLSASCTISALSAHYGFPLPSVTSKPVRWFQGAAPTFDISLFEIFWTLSTGSTLCCAPREFTLQNIDKVVTALEADITNITPSFASLLDPSSISGLMVGGETLNARLLQKFAPYNPTAKEESGQVPRGIYNGYGPTETAIYSIAQAHVPEGQRGSVIGTPLATCGVLIVQPLHVPQAGESLKPLPMGAVGELVITGPQVSRVGYLNRLDETSMAFRDDPQWGRVYKTGDRARIVWDNMGSPMVEFLGRLSDDQVKLSGRRVELGEIESVLASKVPSVKETLSCVWKQGTETGSEKVVSLIVVDPSANFETVHQACLDASQHHLPDYMRPFKILQVDALPRSASGKADRKAALALVNKMLKSELGRRESTSSGMTESIELLENPQDAELEHEIISIVRNVLNDSPTSGLSFTANTVLVDAGIDSLRAMRILRDIRDRWPGSQNPQLEPSLALLLDNSATTRSVFFPTSQDIDTSITKAGRQTKTKAQLETFSAKHMPEVLDKLSLSKSDIEMILPATSTQSQLAVSFAMDKRNYISHTTLRLKPDVSLQTLKDCVETTMSRQPIYRTAMLPCDDDLSPFLQVVVTPEAWQRMSGNSERIAHRKTSPGSISAGVQTLLDLAEENLSLESHRQYQVQIIDPEEACSGGLLIISAAHCICDGPSLEVLMTDITRQYSGLEPLPRHGIYDAVFEWASSLNLETDQLWQKALEGWETEPLGAISGNNVKPTSAKTRQHAMVQHTSPILWELLESKSRALGGSPLTILQASWAMLLHILSEADTDDVTFGSVLSGHHQFVHGPTFSVVPCRVALPEAQTLRQLVGSLMDNSRFAQSHRHTSFGIFKTLPYNTALALQAYPQPEEDGADKTTLLWTEVSNPAIRYDFAMFAEVFPTNPNLPDRNGRFDDVVFKLTYRDETFSDTSASCVVKQFAALTEIILKSLPDDLVQSLPARIDRSLLSAEGTIPVVEEEGLDDAAREIRDRAQLLHAQFEDQAAKTPDLLALSFYSSLDSAPVEMSYAELDARANGLANILREQDIDIIPICMERSIELYVSVLAILKAGSAWCPIDTTSPVQRRTSLIARAQSKVLLTTTESLPLVKPCLAQDALKDVQVILVDRYNDHSTSVRAKPRNSISDITGQDLAYLLWTSGTTGEPKGVMIQHSAAAQAMRDLQVLVEHDDREQVRTLQLSAYSFDVFVQDLFYTWGLAGSVISGTRELVLGTFTEFIWKSRPTHAHLTPSFGASIAVQELKGSTLQYVTFIGEKLTEDVAEAWAHPDITTRAYNTYGPAENAVVSTMRQFFGKSRDTAKAANVGFPLDHCTAYAVREVEISQGTKRWELVPRYGVGELALGGAQVGKGYLANEAKTTKAFIQGGPGIDERIYLTGDLVRLNDHGFEFLGRNDDLVKITGIRIELSEISAACASLKDDDAAVEHVETLYLQRPGAPAGNSNKVVVTFVSVKTGNVDTSEIRSQVFKRAKDLLPAYMVPGHVVVLDTTMPRTASNKVDRKALQAIYAESDLNVLAGRDDSAQVQGQGHQTKQQWATDQLPILETITGHFNLPTENLSPDDSLAGLGLSSLQVTKLAWLLRRELKCQVGVLDLMRCESLGELVDVTLSRMPKEAEVDQSAPTGETETSWLASIKKALTDNIKGDMRPSDTQYILPATPMQESLIVETMLEPQAYWAHRVFDLSHLDDVDDRQLKRAWTVAAKRFDILRTVFVPLTQLDVDGSDNTVSWAREKGVHSTILQLVRENPTLHWSQIGSEDDQSLGELAKKLQLELSPTTTIETPWAVTFVESTKKMMLSMHHALYDAVASDVFLETVTSLYHMESVGDVGGIVQFETGLGLGLLPTPSKRDEAAALWSRRLDEVSKTASGGTLSAPFPDLTQSRQKQAQKILMSRKDIPAPFLQSTSAVALPTLLQSAFGCVLASYLELDAVALGHTISQRVLHPDLARVVGPAIATLPLIIRSNAASSEELWKEMATESAQMFQSTHNLHPVDVKKMLNRGSGSSNAPFPGLFVYHPASDDNQAEAIQSMFKEVGQALSLNVEHPLALNIFEANGTIELTGDGRRISQAQLDLLLDQILAQARVMTEAPGAPLTLLQNRMSKSLLSISGGTCNEETEAVNPTRHVSFHASEHPDWIAVEEVMFQSSDDDEGIASKTLTYAQLDKLANAISTRLTQHEARLQPDDPVAMCLGRDIKSLAVTLAIFRAGFVYLPVDEDLPPARKQLLIRDAGAKLVITTEELIGDLGLDDTNDPPLLLLPDTNDDIDTIMSWPVSEIPSTTGTGGYLLYTSGSTGRPKGVRVSNANLCHFISAFSTRLIEHSPATSRLDGVGKYLNLTSRAFDPHLTQLFVPWHLGHRVVIGRDRTAMMMNLKELINELKVTHFGSVPSVLSQLRLRPEDVPSVRVVTTGGEKASNELLNTWAQTQNSGAADDGAVLFNFYGPTEVTIGCLGHAVHQDSNARNLGLPLQGLEALLLCPNSGGDSLVIARRGQPGELCIAGPQVAIGYHNCPVEQAKSFQTITLPDGINKRVYRTGDMMRMMNDGSLEFLGRADQQTKIRGQRLELDEVVGFLKQVAGDKGDFDFAATVASTVDDSSNQQQQLLGFMAKNPSGPKGQAEQEVEMLEVRDEESTSLLELIENECQDKLPAFMVPTLVWVTKIPYLAASGKVDTKILARLAKDFLASQQDRDGDDINSGDLLGSGGSLSAKESVVVTAIEEAVSGNVKASSTSSIQRLGIDSLSAVNLVSLLRKRGFSQLKMTHLLSSSCTVSDIARLADEQESRSPTNSTPLSAPPSTDNLHSPTFSVSVLGPLPEGLDGSNIEAVLHCLPLQSALIARSLVWLSAFNERENTQGHDVPYVAQFSYRLSRGTDINRWKKTAEQVIASEAMLRTCFLQRDDDGQIFQVVLRSLPSSPLGGHGHPADIVSQMNARPPIRLQFSNVGGDETIVSLNIHHALFDGVAINSLKNKLEAAYNSRTSSISAASSLATLSTISSHCNLPNEQLDATRRSWQQQLQGVQPCRVGAIDDNNTSDNMARQTLCLGYTTSELNARLKAHSLGPEGTVSASSAFQLAVTLCLAQLTKQSSVVYGFIMSLRPLLDNVANDVDSFVGPCLNTLIRVATINSLDETLPQLAQCVHRSHLDVSQGAMPLVSVDKVQRWSGSEDKLFDSLLSINVVPANEPSDAKPGQMTALPTRSSSDMALAFDVDLHADGKIMLTLSSAGALNVEQLKNVGRLFEKVVYSCADKTVKASDVVTFPLAAMTVPTKVLDGPQSNGTSTGTPSYNQALSDVQAILTRFVHLSLSELSSKPDSTTLYQLGLDSITVLPFVKSINKSHKTKLSSHAVIKARTVKGVAQLLHDAKVNSTSVDGAVSHSSTERTNGSLSDTELYDRSLERLAKSLMFIATPLQEGMLSASLATDSDAYTYVHAIQLSNYALAHDTPSLDKFFAAVKDTVQACEILRTRFIFTDNDESPWVGIVSPTEQSDRVSWEVQPTVPGRVHLRIHHSLYDATSIQSIWSILQDYYSRRLNNDLSDGVDAAKHMYKPFARTVASSQRASIAYWMDSVREYTYTPLDFPGDHLKASSAVHISFDTSQLSLLQSKCRDLGVTIKAALQLSWIKVLCESLYRQSDVVYGEVVSTDADDDVAIVGPTINTLPLRVKLGDSDGCINVSQALALVQKQIDSARGINSMASLRKIQSIWRSGQIRSDAPATLFQSLFVFDGVLGTSNTSDDSEKLFKSVQAGAAGTTGPAYDDYPLIVSFHVKDNILNGKLRAKLPQEQVDVLGKSLHAALDHVLHRLDVPVVDTKYLDPVNNTASPETKSDPAESSMNGLTPAADAALKLAETVVGTRRGGKKIGYDTRLITVGLDSILAIRLSKLLRQQLGLSVSVFEIMKGASVRDIIARPTSWSKPTTNGVRHQPEPLQEGLKSTIAKTLGQPEHLIKSIIPALPGQRSHLELWLHNGKRFFEAPWVYRLPMTFEQEHLAACWSELVKVHDVLRTTFATGTTPAELYQVLLSEEWSARSRFIALRDASKTVEELIAEHVSEENSKASDLKEPPVRLSLLEAVDGKAVVLRLHHALYDAWSIKMIEQDLDNILSGGGIRDTRQSLEQVVQSIRAIRQPEAEDAYWRRHLSGAEETILGHNAEHTVLSAHGPQFKTSSNIVPQNSIRSLLQKSSSEVSAAIILSYARTLQHFTQRTKPTFGLNHASRSLSSPDGTQTLDLTAASIPTLSVTPFSIDLESSTEGLLGFIQDHQAQLNCFSQADGVRKLSPMFNSHLNIIYRRDHASSQIENSADGPQALERYRLPEPLASNYFTTTKPSSTVSTIEGLDVAHLPDHHFFFNVIVGESGHVTLSASGNKALFNGDCTKVTDLVDCFLAELSKVSAREG